MGNCGCSANTASMQGGLTQKVEVFEGILWVIITCLLLHQGVLVPLTMTFASPSVFFILNISIYVFGWCLLFFLLTRALNQNLLLVLTLGVCVSPLTPSQVYLLWLFHFWLPWGLASPMAWHCFGVLLWSCFGDGAVWWLHCSLCGFSESPGFLKVLLLILVFCFISKAMEIVLLLWQLSADLEL